ncbi:MAG: superinfection immunity protein [Alphaproteobacteria bacterium]
MDSVLLGLLIVIGLSVYFLPVIVAQIRSTERPGTMFAVNLIFGWTVVGWIVALIWAMGQQPAAEGETARSRVVDSDIWFFDPPNLTKQSAIEPGDGWVLGLERFLESPRHR